MWHAHTEKRAAHIQREAPLSERQETQLRSWFCSITFHGASPIQRPSSSALGHHTHRDRAPLLPQPPAHLHRGPPPRKRFPGLEPACTPLQKDREKPKKWSQSEATQYWKAEAWLWAEKTRGLGSKSQLTLDLSEPPSAK